MKIKIRKNFGFTLIEMLTAVSIFSIVVVIVANIFLDGIAASRKIFFYKSIQESGRFIMESMSRELRMSSVEELDGAWALDNLSNSGLNGPYYSIEVENGYGDSVIYSFDSGDRTISRNSEVLNSDDTRAAGGFYIVKDRNSQPRVVIVLNLTGKSNKIAEQASINLQTSVSSRQYTQ